MTVFRQLFLADFKTPLGTFVILGIHVLPIWLYAHYAGIFTHTLVIPGVLNYLMIAFLSGGRAVGSVVEVSYWSIVVNKKALGGKEMGGGVGKEDIYAHDDIGYSWVMKLLNGCILEWRKSSGLSGRGELLVNCDEWKKNPGWGGRKDGGKECLFIRLYHPGLSSQKLGKKEGKVWGKEGKNWEKEGKNWEKREKDENWEEKLKIRKVLSLCPSWERAGYATAQ